MYELIFSSISLIAFIAFLFISTLGNKCKNRKILKNIFLIILAAMQVILIKYVNNIGGMVCHIVSAFMSLYLLE